MNSTFLLYLLNRCGIIVRHFILEFFWVYINKSICRFFVFYIKEFSSFSLDLKLCFSNLNLLMSHWGSLLKCRFSRFWVGFESLPFQRALWGCPGCQCVGHTANSKVWGILNAKWFAPDTARIQHSSERFMYMHITHI